MINRILHSWSFHMEFMKLAEGSYEMTTRVNSSVYVKVYTIMSNHPLKAQLLSNRKTTL